MGNWVEGMKDFYIISYNYMWIYKKVFKNVMVMVANFNYAENVHDSGE